MFAHKTVRLVQTFTPVLNERQHKYLLSREYSSEWNKVSAARRFHIMPEDLFLYK